MTDENASHGHQPEGKSRRDFVKNSAAVAVTAPAVALLLSASTKSASAQVLYNVNHDIFLDDFTFGNIAEDIDAVQTGSNFTSFGKPAQDDHNAV